ncbi:hypothetical protein [Azospirillum himalayense]|uniref:Uncharacterized protein n=1 Tax=Azospirillum himalayense TaxID=654847 RepID=A0ABW0FY52_9PROT
MKTLSQSLEDATRIIERIHPPGRGATAFSDSPWSVDRLIPDGWVGMVLDDTDGDELTVEPARWPGGTGERPDFGEPV